MERPLDGSDVALNSVAKANGGRPKPKLAWRCSCNSSEETAVAAVIKTFNSIAGEILMVKSSSRLLSRSTGREDLDLCAFVPVPVVCYLLTFETRTDLQPRLLDTWTLK